MDIEDADRLLDSLIEKLATIEHRRWAHWQQYVHSKGQMQPDGSLLLPAHLISQWERQIVTPYDELSDDEQESDREQVRRYLPAIAAALGAAQDD